MSSKDPARWVYRRESTLRLVIGAIVGGAGLGGASMLIARVVPMALLLGPLAVIVGLWGLAFALAASGTELDFRRRRYRRWRTPLLPGWRETGALDSIQEVRVERPALTLWSASHSWTVALRTTDGGTMALERHRAPEGALRSARHLARALRVPLVEETEDAAMTRPPEELVPPFRRRLQLEARPALAPAPAPGGAHVTTQIDLARATVRLLVPASGIGPRHTLFLLAPSGTIALWWLIRQPWKEGHLALELSFWAFLAIFPPLLAVLDAARRVSIEARPGALGYASRTLLGGARSFEVPAERIDRILVGSQPWGLEGQRFTFQSEYIVICYEYDLGHLAFGGHLSREEKLWIRDLIEAALTAAPAPAD